MLSSPNPIEKPTRLTLVGTRISLLRLQNHTFHALHTCTAFWLQNGITSSRFGVQRSHFGFQSVPGRARPARPDGRAGWPSLAGPGWPPRRPSQPGGLARPPGGPVGCFPGGEREKSAGGGAARRSWWSPPTPITAGGLFCSSLVLTLVWPTNVNNQCSGC